MSKRLHYQFYRGFTLIEMVLSIAILTLLAGLMIPVNQSLQNKNSLETATQSVVLAMRQAQTFALGGKNDDAWGIYFPEGEGSIIIFQGSDYSGSDIYDEVTFAPSIIVSGITELVFEKITGQPSETGDIVLTNPVGATKTISINQAGMLFY